MRGAHKNERGRRKTLRGTHLKSIPSRYLQCFYLQGAHRTDKTEFRSEANKELGKGLRVNVKVRPMRPLRPPRPLKKKTKTKNEK